MRCCYEGWVQKAGVAGNMLRLCVWLMQTHLQTHSHGCCGIRHACTAFGTWYWMHFICRCWVREVAGICASSEVCIEHADQLHAADCARCCACPLKLCMSLGLLNTGASIFSSSSCHHSDVHVGFMGLYPLHPKPWLVPASCAMLHKHECVWCQDGITHCCTCFQVHLVHTL